MSVANTLVFSSSAVQIGDDPKVSTNDRFTTMKERQWRDGTREINNSAAVIKSSKADSHMSIEIRCKQHRADRS